MGTIISNTKGQVLITSAQIEWTSQMTQALIAMSEKPELNPLKKVRALYKKKTELYVECVEKPGLNYRDRNKIIALIIARRWPAFSCGGMTTCRTTHR